MSFIIHHPNISRGLSPCRQPTVFQGCTGLLRFEVEEQNKFFTANESVLFSKDLKKLIKYPSKKETQLYTPPSALTEIEEFAFENVDDIVAVQLSNGVQTISNYAFSNCETLQKVKVPTSVRFIGEDAFFGCLRLQEESLHGGVDYIEFDYSLGLIEDLE